MSSESTESSSNNSNATSNSDNSDIENNKTDFMSTKIKEKKVKLLIEELSTIEQVKKNIMEI